jgi:multiple antibiotic resistance protein
VRRGDRVKRELFDAANAVLFSLAALLPIVNPLGSAPIFLSMTADLPGRARAELAVAVARYAFLMLAAAMLIGTYVLRVFGVSLPIVRVAGGLLVTANGWRLLNDDGDKGAETPHPVDTWEREVERRGFYPLTFPLTVGPGSISIAITLGAKAQARGAHTVSELLADLIAAAIVSVTVFLSYRFAYKLIGYLGETGTVVFLRLSSFILLCIGVAIIWSGVSELVQPLLSR